MIIKPEKIIIPGPVGDLESIIHAPIAPVAIAIICHPHPLQQGTMHNKIVSTLEKIFFNLNVLTIRFNFRGVEGSAGAYGNVAGECDDLAAVYAWAKTYAPELPFYFAGFSFGSYVAAWGASTFGASGLVSIAPPVERMPFSDLALRDCKWMIVQGDSDDVVSCAAVQKQIPEISPGSHLEIMHGVGHFFHGKLVELKEILLANKQSWCDL